MTRHSVTPTVMKVLTDRPGQVVYLNELIEKMPPTTPTASIQEAIARKMREGMAIEAIVRGQAWTYHPGRKPERRTTTVRPGKRMFEEVGEAKAGFVILECEDGTIWRAEQL